MSGRHRKPTNTSLCLARVGTLTVMATVPLAIAGTAVAATPTLTDRGSAKWADDDSASDSTSDSDSSTRDSTDSGDWSDSDNSDNSDNSDDSDDSTSSRNDDSGSSADDETPSWRSHRSSRAATDDYSPSWRHTDSPSWKEPKTHTWQKPAKPSWKQSQSPSASAQEARWDKLAQCESTQNWDANTGNGYKGGLQFNDATWRAYGGRQYAPTADQASREQQIAVAKKVQRDKGWHAWPGCSNKLGYT
jgi:hypothetical protein